MRDRIREFFARVYGPRVMPPAPAHLLRFSREELHVAVNVAFSEGKKKFATRSSAFDRALAAVGQHRSMMNRISRKSRKMVEVAGNG